MASGLPRDILKWLLSLNLSFPIKNVRRDLSNGCLVAEIVSRYFPDDIHMHSFENVTSMQRKKAQWGLIEKAFKKYKAPITRKQMDAVMNAEPDAAEDLLQALRAWLTTIAESGSPTRRAKASAAAPARDQDAAVSGPFDPYSQGFYPQQPGGYGAAGFAEAPQQDGYGYPAQAFVFGGGAQEASVAQVPSSGMYPPPYDQQQQYQQADDAGQQQMSATDAQAYYAAYYQAMDYAQAYAQQCAASGGDPYAAYYEAMAQQGFPMTPQQGPDGYLVQHQGPQTTAYQNAPTQGHQQRMGSGAPRLGEKTDYKPYTMNDYKQKQYDPKTAKGGYWELGKIGPDLETDELREKREKAERMKQYGRNAHQKNMSSPAKSTKAKAPLTKEPTARERALEFAKNLPKPEIKKPKEEKRRGGRNAVNEEPLTELERMEMQHRLDQQRIEAIKQEMGRLAV